ncbi:MAG: LOG family protein [Planctomycetes bacterium]|nr:LOG family protein [Planctomycetota bacterium]
MTTARPIITVFGSGEVAPGQEVYELALRVGRRLAELGYDLANGGYGGTMEASARGAAEAGGRTTGVTCSLWSAQPNRYIDRVVVTAGLAERLLTLSDLGRGGYVVLPGATGTLVELAWVWENICKGFMPPRPLVCVGRFWRPVIEAMTAARPRSNRYVRSIDSPDELAGAVGPAAPAEQPDEP